MKTLERLENLKPVIIEWEDATTQAMELKEVDKFTFAPLISIGFLIEDNKEFVMVAGDCFYRETTFKVEDRFRGVVGIPLTFVKNMRKLEVSKKKTDIIVVRWLDARYTNIGEPKFREVLVEEYPPKEVLSIGRLLSEKSGNMTLYQTADTFLKKSDRVMALKDKFISEKIYLI